MDRLQHLTGRLPPSWIAKDITWRWWKVMASPCFHCCRCSFPCVFTVYGSEIFCSPDYHGSLPGLKAHTTPIASTYRKPASSQMGEQKWRVKLKRLRASSFERTWKYFTCLRKCFICPWPDFSQSQIFKISGRKEFIAWAFFFSFSLKTIDS